MSAPTYTDFTRYLNAKKTVDDRAINRQVWEVLSGRLSPVDHSLCILELAAGTGTMLERMLERHLFAGEITYLGLDQQQENITRALEKHQHHTYPQTQVAFQCRDVLDFAADPAQHQQWDLLIANAFLDLLNIPAAITAFSRLLKPAGYAWFTITFDGLTTFLPTIDPALDAQIQRLYHQNMDSRLLHGLPTGGSQGGRRLLEYLLSLPKVDVLTAGSSDWLVFSDNERKYYADEAYFLHFIIETVANALRGHPELDAAAFIGWITERHRQIEHGELIYIAHQLDVLAQFAGGNG